MNMMDNDNYHDNPSLLNPNNYSFNNREFWVCMVSFSLIIIFYLYLCLRCVFSHLSRDRDTRGHITLIPLQLRDIHNPHLLIVPSITGLDPIIVSSLPTFRFRKKVFDRDDDSDDTMINCVICLCDLEGEEKAKLLPNCNHFFHVSCIDTWLNSHSTCPLCRAEVNPSRLEQQDPICFVADDLCALDNQHARLGVDGGSETSKSNGSNLRLSSIRRIFSREISSRRIQPFNHDDDEDGEGVDHDLERQ